MMNLIVQDDENNLADNPLKELVDQYFTELMENTHYEGVLVRSYLLTKPNNQHKIPIQFGLYDFGSGWSRSKADMAGLFIVREPSGNPDSPYYYHLCCPNNSLSKPLRAGKYQQQLESHPGDDGWGLMHFNQINDKIVFSSTAAVYGEPKRIPIMEDDETNPTNTYGETKRTMEKMMKGECKHAGIKRCKCILWSHSCYP